MLTYGGQKLGYIPRDCWLQTAIHEEGKAVEADIFEIKRGKGGMLGFVLGKKLRRTSLKSIERQPAFVATSIKMVLRSHYLISG